MKVPTFVEMIEGRDGIYVPSKPTGSASTLPMDDDEKALAREREENRPPLGFRATPKKKRRRSP